MPKVVVSRWYVVNSRWVEYVNKLRIIISISSVNLSTKTQFLNSLVIKKWSQNQISTTNYHYFHPTLSTNKNNTLSLLNRLFTHNPQSLLLKLIYY